MQNGRCILHRNELKIGNKGQVGKRPLLVALVIFFGLFQPDKVPPRRCDYVSVAAKRTVGGLLRCAENGGNITHYRRFFRYYQFHFCFHPVRSCYL